MMRMTSEWAREVEDYRRWRARKVSAAIALLCIAGLAVVSIAAVVLA